MGFKDFLISVAALIAAKKVYDVIENKPKDVNSDQIENNDQERFEIPSNNGIKW